MFFLFFFTKKQQKIRKNKKQNKKIAPPLRFWDLIIIFDFVISSERLTTHRLSVPTCPLQIKVLSRLREIHVGIQTCSLDSVNEMVYPFTEIDTLHEAENAALEEVAHKRGYRPSKVCDWRLDIVATISCMYCPNWKTNGKTVSIMNSSS